MSMLMEPARILSMDMDLDLPPPPGLPSGVGVTSVFNTYWRFAAERQEIFFRRLADQRFPWTQDTILAAHKFTNAYRASDRISQYLINVVIPSGPQSPAEIFFRILLFKLFNRRETWELLQRELGRVEWSRFSFSAYDRVLVQALDRGDKIYSAAYIMPSGGKADRKHRHHLRLLQAMMSDHLVEELRSCRRMADSFALLRRYPSIGDFLAYQFVTDINYSNLVDFSETEFVSAGPGARDGLRKCFSKQGTWSAEDLIRWVTETQQEQFMRLGIAFRNLWGRPLQFIDCQNLFCEVDKYSRFAHPEVASRRKRIKQRFRPQPDKINYCFPEKWGINSAVRDYGAGWGLQADISDFKAGD